MTRSKLGLLLTAAAAYGYYRYSKMSSQQKNDLLAKGKELLNKNFGGLTNIFSRGRTTANGSY
jgi:hypothetical protein